MISFFIISIIIKIISCYYPYRSNFQFLIINNNFNYNSIVSNLNYNKIYHYNSTKSILYTYDTYSKLDDYKYSYKFLIRNNNTYLIKYIYNINDYNYNYLIFIRSSIYNQSNIKLNICIKYDHLIFDQKKNNKIIYKKIKDYIHTNF